MQDVARMEQVENKTKIELNLSYKFGVDVDKTVQHLHAIIDIEDK